ncbi:hypothetical protein RYX56_04105 [Alkalihalophilus lindianensis]|uniref:Uncharacterized protein n=1 Tax=Alkalihalophilus lindianensis TaxID=1630542 RepID=A0ABU3X6M2_9BACI|nr:hypothetical protein [Alkalihalophilus lindianensis]MDV2683556.1 hypothetical protein [Alkalihalophilus lindianensis]
MLIFLVLLFFSLFFGVMMLGNHMSHVFEQLLEQKANETLARIDQSLNDVNKR